MINALGGISQVGMVVTDADKTMRYMTEKLGIGPFYVVRRMTPEDYQFRGEPAPAPVLTLCFAQAGPVQIELIQQHNDAPSAYREFLAAGREGCQHVSIWFSDRDAYAEARDRLSSAGLTLVHESGLHAPARFAYFETDMPGGLMVEIAEAKTPNVAGFFESIAEAARNWDGAEPIRNVG
jgi:catechol 2,3-dioxygenase-like lactoylglutathione lyase family enzyme